MQDVLRFISKIANVSSSSNAYWCGFYTLPIFIAPSLANLASDGKELKFPATISIDNICRAFWIESNNLKPLTTPRARLVNLLRAVALRQ
jgi:hypothetical protein